MTLGECIRRADAQRPNGADELEKVRWVLEQEGELREHFFPLFEGPVPGQWPMDWPAHRAGTLAASGPFEGFYLQHLLAMLAAMDGEMDRYNAHNLLARQLESDFRKSWSRSHRRKKRRGVKL